MPELTLADKIAQKVVARLLPYIQNGSGSKVMRKRLLNVMEAAAYIGRPGPSSIYHLVARRQIPVVRKGRRLHFDIKKLDRWVEGEKV